ncbi:ATP-binding protein [Chloroflexota bacterium]
MRRFISIFHQLFDEHGYFKGILLLFTSFCILAVSVTFFALSIGKPYMGAELSLGEMGWEVRAVDSNGQASQAGIEVGDIPVVINGQPASLFLERYEEAGMVSGLLIKELTVTDESGQLKSVSLEGGSPSSQSLIELASLLFVCFVFWITGSYAFLKRPRNLAAFLLYLCGLTLGLAISATVAGESLIPGAFWFAIVASVIGPWLLLHFFLVLPEERIWPRNNAKVYLIYVPAAITLILFPIVGYVDGQLVPLFSTVRMLGYGAGFLGVAGVAVFNFFHASSIRTRQQMKTVLGGCLAALIPFLVLYILPKAVWRQPLLPTWVTILFIAFIPLGMGYAIITRRLLDIDVVFRRSMIYGLITIVMTAILSVAIFVTVTFQKSLEIPVQIIIALALGGVAAVLFGPAKKGVEVFVDKFFYKDRYDYHKTIQSLSTSLNSINALNDISRLIVGTIVNTLNLVGGCIFIKTRSGSFELNAAQGIFTDASKQKQLLALISQSSDEVEFPNTSLSVDSDVAFVIPLVTGDERVGILCLSLKYSKQDFSSTDVYLLQGLASVAAVALQRAMLIHDVSIRDTFVSIASHELRTPLTSIMGYAELLLKRETSADTRKKWLENIIAGGQNITEMVDELLNVTHIQSGKVVMNIERVKLPDVLEERLSVIQESTSNHKFAIEIEPSLPEVFVDRDKFQQAVGNLLSNAIKYSPDGGKITLSAHSEPQRRRIVVSVADEGIGIDDTDKELLFTTFHRIRRPETQNIRGSGLGLYIVKEWIEAMGGEVRFESKLNKGSTFFITIPTQDSDGRTKRTS